MRLPEAPRTRAPAKAHRRATRGRASRIGLALAGGGPLGGIYELGALAALSDACAGLDLNNVDVYVGVSAGGFIAAGLANGFTPQQMVRLFIEGDHRGERFDPALLMRPALAEYRRRAARVPGLATRAVRSMLAEPTNVLAALERLGRAIPTGLLDGEPIHRYLSRIFSAPGRTNDFRRLQSTLVLVATDLDTGEPVAFGSPGHDRLPISRAVQASAALPGLFPPVTIEGRHYVDGALRKTLHASIALEAGVDLLLCLNPLVPYDARADTRRAHGAGGAHRVERLVDGGLPAVMAQTFRSIIQSRLHSGMERYEVVYPQADVLLLQPDRADADIFFTNLFSYAHRRRLCEHAYQRTRAELLRRHEDWAPRLARHGIELQRAVLQDPALTLVRPPRRTGIVRNGAFGRTTAALETALDDLDRWVRIAGHARVAAGRRTSASAGWSRGVDTPA